MSNIATITSIDVAEMTGSRHDNVTRSIKRAVNRGVFAMPPAEAGLSADGGRAVRCHVFRGPEGKQASLKLMAQLSPGHTATLVARWLELERKGVQVAPPVPGRVAEVAKAIVAPAKPAIGQDGPTMSSVEIANLTKKDHKHVLNDIRSMLESLEMQSAQFLADYKDSRNRSMPCFHLPRDLTQTLITGYCTPLRHRVITRLNELEAQAAKPTPAANLNDPAALRGLLLGYTEQVMKLEHQVGIQAEKITEDAPKVKVFTKLVDQKGYINFQKFCTQLNLHQRKIKAWLRDIGWLRDDQWEVNPLPTAKAVDAGYCQIKRFETESGKLKQQIVFTGKAEAYVELKAPEYVRKPVRKERQKVA